MQHHVKRRPPVTPGSIPAALKMFESEVPAGWEARLTAGAGML